MFADCSCLPPPFWDLGRNSREVFEQNYTCGTFSISGKAKSPVGIDFKAGGSNCAHVRGVYAFLESNYYWPEYKVNFTERWSTENALSSDLVVTDFFVKGISMGIGSQFSIETGKKKLFFKSGYEMELFNANMDIKIDLPTCLIRGSLVGSMLGWIAGLQIIIDVTQRALAHNSLSLGYYAPGFILHSNVSDTKDFYCSIYQKVNHHLQTSIQMAWAGDSSATQLGFGCVYTLDEITSFRGKFDLDLQFGIGFTHRFNRGVLAKITACVDGKHFSCGNHKAGVGLELEA